MTAQHIYITEPSRSRTFRAGWVIKDPWTILENAGVVVAGGQIKKIVAPAPKDASVKDLGPGVLMAPLVNAHLHLELSALKNRLPLGKGFAPWVAALLRERDAAGTPTLTAAAQKAAASLQDMGVGLVGEISTLGITRKMLHTSGLTGVWFKEFLGDEQAYPGHEEQDPYLKKQFPLSFSAAGHAPHTTAPQLLTALKKRTRAAGLVFSLHAAESEVEMDFIAGKRGGWTDFLASRGIDAAAWPVGNKTPVAYLHDLGVLDNATLGVHLLHVTDNDLDILAKTGCSICLCPRSNQNLHGRLPDIASLLARNLSPALGTDSLASCDSLGIFDEMAFVRQQFPQIPLPDLLAMATINGARALGLGQHGGTLDTGRSAQLLYLDITARTPADVMEKVTAYGI
ncbi:MAG: amidohydrolase family protein [Desulfotignum sp.]|nr:amidohydrolase family protein [Desulfotignum sp.]